MQTPRNRATSEFSVWLEGRDRLYVMRYLEISLAQLVRLKVSNEVPQAIYKGMSSLSKVKNQELKDLVDVKKLPKSYGFSKEWQSTYRCKTIKDVFNKLTSAKLAYKAESTEVFYLTDLGYKYRFDLLSAYKDSMKLK